jgi:putative FmdB family regulatory protein
VPIYVYECDACGERFEYTQSMSEPPKTECEKCRGHLQRVIAPTAFVLKGSGWYKDLYSKPKSSSGGGEGKAETKSEGKSEGKSESKSETKSDAKPDTKTESSSKSETKSETKSGTKTKSEAKKE